MKYSELMGIAYILINKNKHLDKFKKQLNLSFGNGIKF
jgi:L-arabinose isomerase